MFNLACLNLQRRERLQKARIVFAALIASFVCLPAQAQQTPATKTASAPTHTIQFTLTAKDGAAVGDLRTEDVQLMESGEIQQITSLVKRTNSPLTLALMFDRSGSFEIILPGIKAIGQDFIAGIMQPSDVASVVSFTSTAVIEIGKTNNVAELQQAISKIQPVVQSVSHQNPTAEQLKEQFLLTTMALHDAVGSVCTKVFAASDSTERRGIILITDGEDRESFFTLNQAIRQAQFVGVPIYAIGIGDEKNFDKANKGVLNKLAEQTGGAAFYPRKSSDLPAVFDSMKRDLRSYYELTYTPTTGGKARDNSREIKLKIINPTLSKQKIELNYPRHRVLKIDKVK